MSQEKPYDIVFVCGPGVPLADRKKQLEAAKKANPAFSYHIIGDGKRLVRDDEIKAADALSGPNTEWFVHAHGNVKSGKHVTTLLERYHFGYNKQFPDSSDGPTEEFFYLLKQARNLHLISCYGGAAVSSCKAAPQGAALFFHSDDKHSILMFHGDRLTDGLIQKHAEELKAQGQEYRFNPEQTHAWVAARSSEPTSFALVDKNSDAGHSFYRTHRLPKKCRNAFNFRKAIGRFNETYHEEFNHDLQKQGKVPVASSPLSKTEFEHYFKYGLSLPELVCTGEYSFLPDHIKTHPEDINIQSALGKTGLHFTARDSAYMTSQLLKAGANPNIWDNEGRTPLFQAIEHGRLDIVKLLLKHNALIDIQDIHGKTPLSFAKEMGSYRIVNALEKHVPTNAKKLGMVGTPHPEQLASFREKILQERKPQQEQGR